MKTIYEPVTHLYEIQKSKFFCQLSPVQDINEVELALQRAKKEFDGATHYCYAYVIGAHKKCSDDGEPGGTAGMPILNVLENQQLTNVLCIVIRYFGGIKLGAGGLVRAYTRSVTECLSKVTYASIENGYQITILFDYSVHKSVDHLLKNSTIILKNYDYNITYVVQISKQEYLSVKESLLSLVTIQKEEPISLLVPIIDHLS